MKQISFLLRLEILVILTISLTVITGGYANAQTLKSEESPLASCQTLGQVIRSNKSPNATLLNGAYKQREDVKAYALEVSKCLNLDYQWVLNTLGKAEYQASSVKFIMPKPAGARNWSTFIKNFVQPARINPGVKFWSANKVWLDRAEDVYGVPPKVILGILGVETIFGQYTGNFRLVDALTTLSFDFPPERSDRTDFFADELAQYLLFASQQKIDPFTTKGSYAGAMGMPQFMPSSLLAYAVDFDGDGKIDLHSNQADIIGSVANYLAVHGWTVGIPGYFYADATQASAENIAYLREPDIIPTFTMQEMCVRGLMLRKGISSKLLSDEVKLSLVTLENGSDAKPTYVIGTQNFFVVTRYNRSSFYAMSVLALGDAIEDAYLKAKKN